jgi:hypothetical protein
MQATINLLQGLLLKTYLTGYFQLQPGLSREALTLWLAPIAAGRLGERIPGEEQGLLGIIDASLAAI